MYYSKAHDLLYVRVPCTGSTSLLDALNFERVGRADHLKIRDFNLEEYKESRKIGFIRHPIDWVGSVWWGHSSWAEWGCGTRKDTTLLELGEKVDTPLDWLSDELEIWRTEDLDRFLSEMGCKTIPHLNKTDDKETLSEEVVEIIKRRFQREFEYYEGI
jgi:hypothetical protein